MKWIKRIVLLLSCGLLPISKVYSEPCQTYKVERFAKVVKTAKYH